VPALNVLGLVILAAFVVSVFAIGYVYSQKLAELRRAREAALDVDAQVRAAIVTGTDQTPRSPYPEVTPYNSATTRF
jgi:hypothetical protein